MEFQSQPCVIDPVLALSHQGVAIIKQLGAIVEVWIPRELWHIFNNVPFYSQQLSLITPGKLTPIRTPDEERMALEGALWSLREWEKMRWETDLCGLNLFWLGDSLGESLLPKHQHPNLFKRWEAITRSLDHHLDYQHSSDSILYLALRDTVSLAGSLNSAFILTYQLPSDLLNRVPPDICKILETWGIPCCFLPAEEAIVSAGRMDFRQILIQTGLAKLLWAGLQLIVLQLFLPAAPITYTSSAASQFNSSSEADSNFWAGAQGFWYQI